MPVLGKIKGMFQVMTEGKIFKYASIRCEVLSECMRRMEDYFQFRRMHYTRLIDPDPYLLETMADSLYERGQFLGVVELKAELSRAFYFLDSDVPIELKDIPGLEFTLTFRVRKKEGLQELLGIIGKEKAGRIRHKHRSTLNFLISLLSGTVFSSVMEFRSYWSNLLVTIFFALILYLVLDYPFSLLYFKGVEVMSTGEVHTKVFVVKVRMGRK
ncbi:hypothetical protein [Thermococcus barophilus]|uniref:Uncharacterized protein n=1 Tax=Thermococcus barophilus (strain DSM 11836 / MP) TaxID=391623 RepID=F0LJ31_THEBM|nr:hypothetical protein [Thermococcus barophilus]ADT83377.1 hypothetical protein TERMP_00400 [Thermococcus barophilus MP]